MVVLERDIEQKLGAIVRKRGGLYYKFTSPGNVGVPDRIVITPQGKIIFVEIKTESGVLSKMQKIQIERLKANRVDVRVIKGWASAEKFIEEEFPE